MSKKETLKQQILELTREYYTEVHGQPKTFEAGKTFVNYGGRYYITPQNLDSLFRIFFLSFGHK